MLDSLTTHCPDFRLYVLAMDNECFHVLSSINSSYLIPIRLEDFENNELLGIKNSRTKTEYYWTCSSFIIAYVLDNFEDTCTYIDADMYFYNNPNALIVEMITKKCSTQIIPHRFGNTHYEKCLEKRSGKYCVEFNTFTNTPNSRKILRWWQDMVIISCTDSADGKQFGDQKYLDDWTERFSELSILDNLGAGVAPWNISQYKLLSRDCDGTTELLHNSGNKHISLIFYHFHNLKILNDNTANIGVYSQFPNVSSKLVDAIYAPYINSLFEKRKVLKEKYNLCFNNDFTDHTSIKYTIQQKSIYKIFNKLHGYDIIAIVQYLWLQRNQHKNIKQYFLVEDK